MIDGQQESYGDSFYQSKLNEDVITGFRPLLEQGGFKLRDADGKIEVDSTGLGWNTPWHHVAQDYFLDCNTWHRIMFDFFSRPLPEGQRFVPSPCQQCWKVVVRPKNLTGLFALLTIQGRLGRPSKCGMEIRPAVHGLYGGYFYNHSIEQGLECYNLIRDEVDADINLGPDVVVLLKRACTEYEQVCGPSDQWKVTNFQRAIETKINKVYVKDHTTRIQPDHAISFVHKSWIEWAYQNGDETYLKFTNGIPLYKPYVTYQHLLVEPGDPEKKEKRKIIRTYDRKVVHEYDL